MQWESHFEHLQPWAQGSAWFKNHAADERRFQRSVISLYSAGLLPLEEFECEEMLAAAIAHFEQELGDLEYQRKRIRELARIAVGAGPFLDLCGEVSRELERITS